MNSNHRAIKKRFLALNESRIKRTQESLRWKQRDFLELLPLLFHVNYPILPGFISKNVPAGIQNFAPGKSNLAAARRFSKTFTIKKRALQSYDLISLFLMGSSGTVAYSQKSDFDIWICHKSSLKQEDLIELNKKAKNIEIWAATLDLDVHFFLMDAQQFKSGHKLNLSSESSGSAQHNLLLEEFYRTSLLIAGSYPIWWLVPPDQEHNYNEYVEQLLHKRFIFPFECIDFGGLSHIPAEEFFGAALWQVYKGIDSPYKSVLKILLMENYAREYPKIDLLCMRFKQAVYDGVENIDQLDPYIMLLNKLEHYLDSQNNQQRLELIRRCFYFKANVQLSTIKDHTDTSWRIKLLRSLITEWQWNDTYIRILDSRDAWKINRVIKERKILVDELTNCYLFLSNFGRENANLVNISQHDLSILGKKLYAAFERKAGKIEIVNRGIAPNLTETHISFNQIRRKDGQQSWLLFHGVENTSNSKPKEAPLKRANSIITLLVWCHFNKLMNSRTVISLHALNGDISVKEIKSITQCLQKSFPEGNLPDIDIRSLANQALINTAVVYVNTGIDPISNKTRAGIDIISNKSDILNYSGFSVNLALSFDLLIVTSWQEVLVYTYHDINGLLECLCQYLQFNVRANGTFSAPPIPQVYSFSSNHAISITNRIQELFQQVVSCFQKHHLTMNARFILECSRSYYVINNDQRYLQHTSHNSLDELGNYLGKSNPIYHQVYIDKFTLNDTLLPTIFNLNKRDAIQLFYQINGKQFEIFVVDEKGSLFMQKIPLHDETTLINQFDQFFESILYRRRLQAEMQKQNHRLIYLEYFRIKKNKMGKRVLEHCHHSRDRNPRSYFNIQVIGNSDNIQTQFSVFCDDAEFSSDEYGNELFQVVAKHILALRKQGQRYPIYITDLDLSPSIMNTDSWYNTQTVNYLYYKRRIEERLNHALNSL